MIQAVFSVDREVYLLLVYYKSVKKDLASNEVRELIQCLRKSNCIKGKALSLIEGNAS